MKGGDITMTKRINHVDEIKTVDDLRRIQKMCNERLAEIEHEKKWWVRLWRFFN